MLCLSGISLFFSLQRKRKYKRKHKEKETFWSLRLCLCWLLCQEKTSEQLVYFTYSLSLTKMVKNIEAIPIKCFVSPRPPSREGRSVGRAKERNEHTKGSECQWRPGCLVQKLCYVVLSFVIRWYNRTTKCLKRLQIQIGRASCRERV